jgi:predicted metalloprotease with PDZ domain
MSSLGKGDIETVGPIDRIFSSYFMAGRLGRFPEEGNTDGFCSAWLGTPPFDARELMVWTAKAFTAIKSFFRDTSSDSFRFFMRAGPDNDGVGGGCLQNSIMLFVPEESELAKDLRGTVAHEIIHKYIGELKEQSGENRWYSEGLVVHYTRLLMFRARLFSASEFLDDVNRSVLRYWTNPLRNLPNDIDEERYWSDRNALVIPYDRGSLYFADVDAKIQAASRGKRSLDDVILELFERRIKGERLSRKSWLEALEKEIGPSAFTDFESIIIKGENFVPASNAFGDCFERVPMKLRVFELGFNDAASLLSPKKKVTGLVKGSAAERAGLQNGDIILSKVDLRSLRKNENLELSLKVRRGDETLQIEYLPRGESVDGYKWIRNSDVPEEKCR